MDKLLEALGHDDCSSCTFIKIDVLEEPCNSCSGFSKFIPNDTIKEIDRLIKLGRRYDTDTEINRVMECRWAKEVK